MHSFLNEMYYAHNNAQMIYRDIDYILKENFQLQEGKQTFLFLLVTAAAVCLIHTLVCKQHHSY